MDRTWMINRSAFDRRQAKYIEGVEGFLEFAFKGKDEGAVMRCPCMDCFLSLFKDRDSMWQHLMEYGIMSAYDPWEFHGEDPVECSDNDDESSGGDLDIDDDKLRDGSHMSYRQKRRIQQLQRGHGKRTRGQTQGIKWKKERNHKLGVKPSLRITKDMKRIVGENTNQFITEVGNWVRTMLPLRCRRWNDMDAEHKQRLFNKIKVKWILSEGENIDQAVENQCKILYRQWRYRLKEKYFDGFSIAEAMSNCPEGVHPDDWRWIVEKHWGSEKHKRISQVNRANRAKQKVKAIQGSKSTSRILELLQKHCELATISQASKQITENSHEGTEASQKVNGGVSQLLPPPPPQEPEYVRLWEMTKRHKDKSMDKIAEQKLEEFKKLHQEQLELYGVDNLTVPEAYMRVMGTCSGYINGLGFGPKPPKGRKEGKSTGESIDLANQLKQRFEQLEKDSREREAQLKEEIQRLQQDNVAMQEEIEKLKREAREREEREERMLEEHAMMQKQIISITSSN